MSEEMKGALGTEQNLAAFRAQVQSQLGVETTLVDESTAAAGELQVYVRKATFSTAGTPVKVQWVFNPKGQIAGFRVQPAAP
jgi:hypothetical protein